ncbi:Protein CL16A, partial [Gamsiella multidivaricata]
MHGDANEESIVSCLKELTQLLIWGDQHDPLLLEHFFEQNVHWHFLKILKSKHDGSLIVQVLQTLNIMFENVRSRESLYFLLSNNYVNQVICLKYDFSNDEILAYYIYLLRTLSFKLSKDTIYFFFNEHLDDFPLDGEFSRINYYLAEHMDCFYYVNDIIELDVSKVNKILISHLLNRLLRPMYLDSLLPTGAQGSSSNKSSSSAPSPKLMPLVALSLLLHAFHVLKHAPLVSALTSTLFSNQYRSSHVQHQHISQSHLRHSPSPLVLGSLSVSPESSRPASPVTSKFHSFGLLGSSPASLDSYLSASSIVAPQAHVNIQHSLSPHSQPSPRSFPSSALQQQQNPYKALIYEYLSRVDSDRLVLPALTLVYLTGHNPGVMSDVLLGTDIYPQRLLKSKMLMGNLMSSAPATKGSQGTTAMSRERSSDSMLSASGAGGAIPWNASTPGPGGSSTINGSLFGAAGSATAARMRTRTESPLFEAEEYSEETQETQELLASEDPGPALPPNSSLSLAGASLRTLSSSLPSSSAISGSRATDDDVFVKAKARSRVRKGSKASSLLGPIFPATSEDPAKRPEHDRTIEQELRPVYTSKEDREAVNPYPSSDEEDSEVPKDAREAEIRELDSTVPPPLPPRPQSEQQQDETESLQDSVSTQIGPIIQNREDLMDRLMDIICGMPESGAHRFRIITIQMAAELLIEFVLAKSGTGVGKESQGNTAAQQAAESRLGEARLQRLALAEAQFRERVQKGIRSLERKKKTSSGHQDYHSQPLGMLTGRIERALTESKIGIDKQIVNIIAESNVIYGPDKDLDKEPDLDPDADLIALFELDPEYVGIRFDKHEEDDGSFTLQTQADQSLTSGSSAGSALKDEKRSRSRIRSRVRGIPQFGPGPGDFSRQQQPIEHIGHPPPSRLSGIQRMEAMVIRYIKWLHLLIQCRQLVCRKSVAPTMALFGTSVQPMVVTTSVSANPGAPSVNMGSPSISITESFTPSSTQRPTTLGRRPSDLMGLGSSSGTVVSTHKGLQKALATTATITTTALGGSDPKNLAPTDAEEEALLASTEADSALNSASASVSSSTSSLSSALPSPAVANGGVSAMLSRPSSGAASGRIIGSRTLLSATAALEAAANSANHGTGVTTHTSSPLGPHPFINEMLTNHLDPLNEAIRKTSARIKKTVVDPLSTNHLFKSSPTPSAASSAVTGQENANRGFYRPSVASSAASSVASLTRPGSNSMQRSISASSSSSSHSVAATTIAGGGSSIG